MTREEAIRNTHAYLTGQLTEKETGAFLKWRDASEENAALCSEITEAWEMAHSEMQFPEFNADAAFARLPIQQQRGRDKRRRIYPVWRAAAAVTILATVAWIVYDLAIKVDSVTVVADQQQRVELPDASIVYLDDEAALTYPARFSRNVRKVRLEGTAYFDVHPDLTHPFVVDAIYADMIVVGTEFGVIADASLQTSSLYVKEGLVRMHPHLSNQEQYVEAGAGEAATYNDRTSVLQKLREPNMNAIAWHTREISFVDTPVPEVIQTLEEAYDVQIDYTKSGITACQFTSPLPFEEAPVEEILGTLAAVFQLQVTSPEEGQYVLIGGSCDR